MPRPLPGSPAAPVGAGPRRPDSPVPDACGADDSDEDPWLDAARGSDIGIGPRAPESAATVGRSLGGGASGRTGSATGAGASRRSSRAMGGDGAPLASVGGPAEGTFAASAVWMSGGGAAGTRVGASPRAPPPLPTDADGRVPPRAPRMVGASSPGVAWRSRSGSRVDKSTKRGGSSTARQTSQRSASRPTAWSTVERGSATSQRRRLNGVAPATPPPHAPARAARRALSPRRDR